MLWLTNDIPLILVRIKAHKFWVMKALFRIGVDLLAAKHIKHSIYPKYIYQKMEKNSIF